MIFKIILFILSIGIASAEEFDLESNLLLNQDESLDPEAVEGDYDERVKAMQKWLWRREAERKIQGLNLEDSKPEDHRLFSSLYFEENGYDEKGFRRLSNGFHVKLRHQTALNPGHSKKPAKDAFKTKPLTLSKSIRHPKIKSQKPILANKSLKPGKTIKKSKSTRHKR